MPSGVFGKDLAHKHDQLILGILPGEGVGPEVIGAALRILDALESVGQPRFTRLTGGAIGFEADPAHDGQMTENVATFCQDIFDRGGALLCGPGRGRFVYDLRRRFDLFCKLAPIIPNPALHQVTRFKPEVLRNVNILIVRDNVAGVYQGQWAERVDPNEGRVAEHRFSYSEAQVQRIVEVGVRLAKARQRRMQVVIKVGGVPGISELWRGVSTRVAADSGVACVFLNADLAAYRLIQYPQEFDVLVAPNLMGDVLADLGAVLLGSRGLSYSGNFSGDGRAVYQTGHGAALDLAGTDRANPLAQILSLAMMLRESYGLAEGALLVEQAVNKVLQAGWRTDDLAETGCRAAGTRQMGDLIAQAIVDLAETRGTG
jgi:3-isopropylmalate dehydrogenase